MTFYSFENIGDWLKKLRLRMDLNFCFRVIGELEYGMEAFHIRGIALQDCASLVSDPVPPNSCYLKLHSCYGGKHCGTVAVVVH